MNILFLEFVVEFVITLVNRNAQGMNWINLWLFVKYTDSLQIKNLKMEK